MADVATTLKSEPWYRGLRMTADQYLALAPDGFRYELVDGVICRSPSPTPRHQSASAEIARQIGNLLVDKPMGCVYVEVDVKLRDDLVYRPDVVYLGAEKAARCGDAITEIPDLVVEIISPDSRRYDSETKRDDYEAAGVPEVWLIDSPRRTFRFLVLHDGKYVDVPASSPGRFRSTILPGLELDLDAIRRLF